MSKKKEKRQKTADCLELILPGNGKPIELDLNGALSLRIKSGDSAVMIRILPTISPPGFKIIRGEDTISIKESGRTILVH